MLHLSFKSLNVELYKHDLMDLLTLQHSSVETSHCIYTHRRKRIKKVSKLKIEGYHCNRSSTESRTLAVWPTHHVPHASC